MVNKRKSAIAVLAVTGSLFLLLLPLFLEAVLHPLPRAISEPMIDLLPPAYPIEVLNLDRLDDYLITGRIRKASVRIDCSDPRHQRVREILNGANIRIWSDPRPFSNPVYERDFLKIVQSRESDVIKIVVGPMGYSSVAIGPRRDTVRHDPSLLKELLDVVLEDAPVDE